MNPRLSYKGFPCPNGVKRHYTTASGPTMASVLKALRAAGWRFQKNGTPINCPHCDVNVRLKFAHKQMRSRTGKNT